MAGLDPMRMGSGAYDEFGFRESFIILMCESHLGPHSSLRNAILAGGVTDPVRHKP
jgi:hypothetical protein